MGREVSPHADRATAQIHIAESTNLRMAMNQNSCIKLICGRWFRKRILFLFFHDINHSVKGWKGEWLHMNSSHDSPGDFSWQLFHPWHVFFAGWGSWCRKGVFSQLRSTRFTWTSWIRTLSSSWSLICRPAWYSISLTGLRQCLDGHCFPCLL